MPMNEVAYDLHLNRLMPATTEFAGLTFADLFAGIGGFHRALSRLGMRCELVCEKDRWARAAYAKAYDISDLLPRRRFPDDINDDFRCGNIDILCGGFPCQPFSQMGIQQGFDDQRNGQLFFSLARVIEKERPPAFLLENVRGILSIGHGAVWREILCVLRALDYDVIVRRETTGTKRKFLSIEASEFGLPQLRPRVFIVGFDKRRGGKGDFALPAPLSEDDMIPLSEILGGKAYSWSASGKTVERTVAWTLTAKGHGDRKGVDDEKRWQHEKNRTKLKIIKDDEEIFREVAVPERLQLLGFPADFFSRMNRPDIEEHPLDVPDTEQKRMTGNSVAVTAVYHIGRAIAARVRDMLEQHPRVQHKPSGFPVPGLFPALARRPRPPAEPHVVVKGAPPSGKPPRQYKSAAARVKPPTTPAGPSRERPEDSDDPRQFIRWLGLEGHVAVLDATTETFAFLNGLNKQIELVRRYLADGVTSLPPTHPKMAWFRQSNGHLVTVFRHRNKVVFGDLYEVRGGLTALEKAYLKVRHHAATDALEDQLLLAVGKTVRQQAGSVSPPVPKPPSKPPIIITCVRTEDDYGASDDDFWDIRFSKTAKRLLSGWTGSKMRLLDLLGEVIPWQNRLVEPFVGSAAVALNFAYRFAERGGRQRFLCADANPDITAIYRFVADPDLRPEFEQAAQALFGAAEAEYLELLAGRSDKDSKKEAKSAVYAKILKKHNRLRSWKRVNYNAEYGAIVLWLQRNSYRHILRYSDDGRTLTSTPGSSGLKYPDAVVRDFGDLCASGDIEFTYADFRQLMFVGDVDPGDKKTVVWLRRGDTVYCDPPYIDAQGNTSTLYGKPFTADDHRDLASLAAACAAKGIPVVISNDDNSFTRALYTEFGATYIIDGIVLEASLRKAAAAGKSKREPKDRSELMAVWEPPAEPAPPAAPRVTVPHPRGIKLPSTRLPSVVLVDGHPVVADDDPMDDNTPRRANLRAADAADTEAFVHTASSSEA